MFERLSLMMVVDVDCYTGHGLVAHDIIQDLCMLSGITDISANIVGNTHKLNMVKAFFKAVSKQKYVRIYSSLVHPCHFRKARAVQ
jgi:ribosomal protein S5